MIPITRIEHYLAKMNGEDVQIPTPITREEIYLAKICGENIAIPEPVTTDEMFLYALAGGEISPPKPVTRLQNIMAKRLGLQAAEIEPVTRQEYFWLSGGLPDGYTQVKGFSFNSDCYFVITDLKLRGSDTVRISIVPNAACNVFGCYTTSDATDNYSLYVSTATNAKYLRYNGGTYKSRFASSTYGEQFNLIITPTGSHGFPEGQNDEWNAVEFEASVDMCIGTTAVNATSAKFKGDLIGAIIVDGRFKGIPCRRDSDDALGYYDLVSKTFYEPAAGTPTVVS